MLVFQIFYPDYETTDQGHDRFLPGNRPFSRRRKTSTNSDRVTVSNGICTGTGNGIGNGGVQGFASKPSKKPKRVNGNQDRSMNGNQDRSINGNQDSKGYSKSDPVPSPRAYSLPHQSKILLLNSGNVAFALWELYHTEMLAEAKKKNKKVGYFNDSRSLGFDTLNAHAHAADDTPAAAAAAADNDDDDEDDDDDADADDDCENEDDEGRVKGDEVDRVTSASLHIDYDSQESPVFSDLLDVSMAGSTQRLSFDHSASDEVRVSLEVVEEAGTETETELEAEKNPSSTPSILPATVRASLKRDFDNTFGAAG